MHFSNQSVECFKRGSAANNRIINQISSDDCDSNF